MYITAGLTNYANMNDIVSKANYRLAVMREIYKFADKRTKLILMNFLMQNS